MTKKGGQVWAENKTDAIGLLSQIEITGGKNETPIDAVELGRCLTFRSGVSKFVVLLTNEEYPIANRYGIETIQELSDLLKADKKITAVITKPQFEETYQPLITSTVGKYFYIYEDFSTELKDFILSKIKAEKGYHVIHGASMEPILLKEPLKKNGKADTDKDGLTDSQEADWEFIKVSGETVTLPTLYECVKEATGKEETAFDRFGTEYANQIKKLEILPILSDPTRKDSDLDGVLDREDEYPLDKEMTHLWMKMEDNGQVAYVAQGKEGSYYSKMLLAKAGSQIGQVYEYKNGEWVDTGKEEVLPEEFPSERARAAKKNYKDAILNELTKKIRRVESSIREIFISRGYDVFHMSGEEWTTVYLGAVGGVIDSCVKNENVWQRIFPDDGWDFARNLLNPVRTLRPSSTQLKSVFFQLNKRKEKELLGKYYYQKAKSDMEFTIYCAALLIQYKSFAAAVGLAAGVTVKGGGAALAVSGTGAGTVVVGAATAATAVTALTASGLLLMVGKDIGKVADRALKKGKEDIPKEAKINGIGNSVKSNTGKVIDTTPSTNHTTVAKSPGLKGEPNSIVDIMGKNGELSTRRWYDQNGNQIRDVDMTNHGNPGKHPEVPHEHGPR